MNDLFISVNFNNRTFNVFSHLTSTTCSYEIKNKYITSLVFAKNAYASVSCKNVKFSGTVIKRNKWNVLVDLNRVLYKEYKGYCYEVKNIKQNVDETKKEISEEYSKNTISIYNQIINDLFNFYSSINNKDIVKYQLHKYLEEQYGDIEDLDEVIEYEDFRSASDEEEPAIEIITIRKDLLKEFEEFLCCFKQSEEDITNKGTIITLENIIKETPELKKIPFPFLKDEFSKYINDNSGCLFDLSIYYNRFDVLHSIGIDLYNKYRFVCFKNILYKKINEIISAKNINFINKEEVKGYFENKYNEKNIPNDKELEQEIGSYINKCISFYNLYNKFYSLYNSDRIKVELTEDMILLFKQYDDNKIPVDTNYTADYEVYKYVLPYYKECMFCKNSKKYKPIIENLQRFTSYGTEVIDILINNNVLIHQEDMFVYNEFGEIEKALAKIDKLLN